MKTIILDRDGVINQDSDEFIKSVDEWQPIPGSLEAIALLHRHDYRVVVITNQSGIARGLFSLATLNDIHRHMLSETRKKGGLIEAIFFCPHGPDDGCNCRKPLTGMYKDMANRLKIEMNGVPAVGDSMRDLQAAHDVGALPVLVKTGKGKQQAFIIDALPMVYFDFIFTPIGILPGPGMKQIAGGRHIENTKNGPEIIKQRQ